MDSWAKQVVEVLTVTLLSQVTGHWFHLVENRKQTKLLEQIEEHLRPEKG